jgi:hypothetical protein
MVKRDFKRIKRLHIEPFSAAIKKNRKKHNHLSPPVGRLALYNSQWSSELLKKKKKKNNNKTVSLHRSDGKFRYLENQQKLGAKRMADEREDTVLPLPDFTLIAVVAI